MWNVCADDNEWDKMMTSCDAVVSGESLVHTDQFANALIGFIYEINGSHDENLSETKIKITYTHNERERKLMTFPLNDSSQSKFAC